ncbi:MAG: FAD-dependent thymidylate synthase [archaeon]
MKVALVETNTKDLIELENFLEKNEVNEETFIELAKPINFSFSVEECSRLISHHICESLDSYTQQSQRYVKMGKGAFVIPKEIKKSKYAKEYSKLTEEIFEFYNNTTKLKEGFSGRKATEADYANGIKIEDGRYILPLSTTTNVFTTMNFSRIINFYKVMRRVELSESRELLKKLDKSIGELTKKKKSKVVKLINKFSKKGANNSIVNDFARKHFDELNHANGKNIVLVNSFEKPIIRSGLGALTSTNEKPPFEIYKQWSKEGEEAALTKAKGVTERVLGYNHESIIEHARTTFALEMSLTCYHQFERHRLPSNIRERLEELLISREIITPPSIKRNTEINKVFLEKVSKTKELRKKILTELGKEAQSYLLLNCDLVKVISSTNARIDNQVLAERTCNNAQWEIRDLYNQKLLLLKKNAPVIYDKAGPPCTRGPCPEGTLTCGKSGEMIARYGYHGKQAAK